MRLTITTVAVLTLAISTTAIGQTCVVGEPPAPSCMNPRVVPGSVGHHAVFVDASTATGFVSECLPVPMGRVTWLAVIPEVTGPLTVSTCHPATTYDTVISVYRGGDGFCNSWDHLGCNDDVPGDADCVNGCTGTASKITIDAQAGAYYRIAVGAFADNSAECPLCLGVVVTVGTPCGDPPLNSFCADARVVDGSPGSHSVVTDVTGAVTLPGEPTSPCTVAQSERTTWYRVTPSVEGWMTVDTCHPLTNFDTVLSVHRGDCNVLSYVGCDDDWNDVTCNACAFQFPRSSRLYLRVAEGDTYLIQVATWGAFAEHCNTQWCVGLNVAIFCAADLDGDGLVGFSDVVALLADWGPCFGCAADLDQDDNVGFSDLVTMLASWGPCV